jgi:uncharacterized protein (DUF433 family)/predicted nucleotidyltransferase
MNENELLQRITTNRSTFNGKPIVRGHRIAVEHILGMLAAGDTFKTLLKSYPSLAKEDLQACLLYAQYLVRQEISKLSIDDLPGLIPNILEQAPYIKLLVLFGSRARGDAIPNSDWDFAFLCDEDIRKQYEKGDWDSYRVWGILQKAFQLLDDQIDVVDMGHCSDLLAHDIAQDGQILYERNSGEFTAFKQAKLMTPEAIKQLQRELWDEINQKLQELQQ